MNALRERPFTKCRRSQRVFYESGLYHTEPDLLFRNQTRIYVFAAGTGERGILRLRRGTVNICGYRNFMMLISVFLFGKHSILFFYCIYSAGMNRYASGMTLTHIPVCLSHRKYTFLYASCSKCKMLPEQLPFIQYCSDSMMFTGAARRARTSSCIFYQ